jgi:diguanylate cyclase (GGDEF)-like protein/PAS domain S-box-containing protein
MEYSVDQGLNDPAASEANRLGFGAPEASARASVESIAALCFKARVGMMITDQDGRIILVNAEFTRITGYAAEEAVGRTPALLHSGKQGPMFYRDMWRGLRQDHYWQGEIWNQRKNGQFIAEWLTISAILDEAGNPSHFVGIFSDITKNKEVESEVHRLAYYDPLTQLPNRRLLQDRLGQALVNSHRTKHYGALLFLDLDDFKDINDSRGHSIGDQLLIEVARRLRHRVRAGDTVARQGGDEFIVILDNLGGDTTNAANLARRITEELADCVAKPYRLGGVELHCVTSIGISLIRDQASVEELLRQADMALYKAKSCGGDTVCFFDPSMQAALDKRSVVLRELRQALPSRQLELHFQPQLDAQGTIQGAEALLRWHHPTLGMVPPGEFIHLAEETSLIMPIGRWVLETACAHLKRWTTEFPSQRIVLAVNVSPRQFRHPCFVDEVRDILRATAIDSTRLKIELTESLLIDNVDETVARMHELRALGVRFSLDDFGTGFSSLAYLKRLPLDQLKIDRSFVNDLESDPNDAAIVHTIITMGHTLGLDVIAEGVETAAQLDYLRAHGCHAFQGYFFSRPLPVAEFEAALRANTVNLT